MTLLLKSPPPSPLPFYSTVMTLAVSSLVINRNLTISSLCSVCLFINRDIISGCFVWVDIESTRLDTARVIKVEEKEEEEKEDI